MSAVASILGFSSSCPPLEISSDDEGSIASEAHAAPVKPEKKSKKEEVVQDLKVESDKEEGDEDDEEIGEDEYVPGSSFW